MLTVCHNTIWIVCRNVTAKPSLFRLGYSGNVWLGGTELDGNVWVWSLSGTAIESGLWRPGQPNERSPPRYTYAKRSNVRLYDANDQQMRFMCETSAGFASCWTKWGTAGKEYRRILNWYGWWSQTSCFKIHLEKVGCQCCMRHHKNVLCTYGIKAKQRRDWFSLNTPYQLTPWL